MQNGFFYFVLRTYYEVELLALCVFLENEFFSRNHGLPGIKRPEETGTRHKRSTQSFRPILFLSIRPFCVNTKSQQLKYKVVAERYCKVFAASFIRHISKWRMYDKCCLYMWPSTRYGKCPHMQPTSEGDSLEGTTRNTGWGCADDFPQPFPYLRPKCAIFPTVFQTRLKIRFLVLTNVKGKVYT